MQAFVLLMAFLAATMAQLGLWYLPNRPVELAAPWGGWPLKSVSFAPYRDGQNPVDRIYPTAAEIEADLALLAGKTRVVRLYASSEGFEAAARNAPKYGIEVTAGAWLGRIRHFNEDEIAALISQANRYPDAIRRVIVGNEVLLRRDLSKPELINYIRRVRAAVRQPVSYADVWEYWLKNPEIAAEVDFVTVHILPYWEDKPVGVDRAMAHILAVYRTVEKAFPGKPILIGEVGWPTFGRARGPAVPGLHNAAQFLSAFLHLAETEALDYNIVETFDQTWKTAFEGTVGAHWGLFDKNRRRKFDLAGPVAENPDWKVGFGVSLAMVGVLWRWWLLPWWTTAARHPRILLALPALAAAYGGLVGWAGVFLWQTGGGLAHLLGGGVEAALGVLFVILLMTDAENSLALNAPQRLSVGKATRALFWLFGALALAHTLMLIADGRYRDFPIAIFALPAIGFWFQRLALLVGGTVHELAHLAAPGLTRLPAPLNVASALGLGLGLMSSAGVLLIVETAANRQALAWSGLMWLMAVPFLLRALISRPTARDLREAPSL
jgi:exo-beta-1,3-glucanase (GH17 family)